MFLQDKWVAASMEARNRMKATGHMLKKNDLISSRVYGGWWPEDGETQSIDIQVGQKARLLETPRDRNKDKDIAWIELVGGPHDGHQRETWPIASDWEYAP